MKALLTIFICLFSSTVVFASATSNEFAPCKKVAASKLEYCLRAGDSDCLDKSKLDFDSCYKRIIQSHSSESLRAKAEKEARDNDSKKANQQ